MTWTILFLSFLSTANFSDNDNIAEIRHDFHLIENKDDLLSFLDNYKDSDCDLAEPFIAAASMQMARHAFITKKMRYFTTGKERLELYIKNNPTSVEAKYIRLLIQKEIPSFLNYNDSIESDREFIVFHLPTSNLPKEYQKIILQNIQK